MKGFFKVSGLVLLAVALFAGGCRYHKSPEKRAEFIVKKITSELDLNDSQKKELYRIKDEILSKRKELKLQGPRIPTDALAEFRQPSLDEKKINKAFELEMNKMTEMRTFMTKKAIEFHAILNPEQRNKLVDLITEFQQKHRHHDD
ncbi:putative lipoprotein [Leptospira weilii serovar Ranarum str. ICFT]|uniref:Lipoprotein n=1 Tax=Leptospira weilii serovar Ranarum str. ICFT TaxID=1218598 RepID=N1WQ16_9LEPT|nr:Spy/CpxP family protein refolding chaperone [Leptospira weilii]EMY79347.1 putative lipoprotein [Leptospira weilii serovar Ranarum str. ICFT]